MTKRNRTEKETTTPGMITKTELVNKRKLRWIMDNMSDLGVKNLIQNKDQRLSVEAQKNIIKKYLRNISGGEVDVTYGFADKNVPIGRKFTKNTIGLQRISRKVRNTVASEYYDDIDMVNAHPEILYQYCQKNDIHSPQLSHYINNREQVLASTGQPRKTAKKHILKVMNGGKAEYKQYDTKIHPLFDELNRIRMTVGENNPDIMRMCLSKKQKKKEHTNNISGSAISTVLNDIENNILTKMDEFFTSKHLHVDVLLFDGCMVRKDPALTSELLNECSSFVYESTGYNMKLVTKPMDDVYEIPALEELSYDKMKDAFEEHHFKCISESCFYTVTEDRLRRCGKSDLITSYEHLNFINDNGYHVTFIKKWLADSDIRSYKYVECVPPPLVCSKDTYNLWSGFACESWTYEKEDERTKKELKIIKDHVLLLCNDDKDVYTFVMNWLACLFQKPGYKNNIAMLFKSKQGLGKDLFYELLKSMIGDTYSGNTEEIERDVFGQFNSFIRNKILICLNEVSPQVGFKYSDKIKNLITCKEDQIRVMRTDVQQVKSFTHYIMFTNNDFPIKVEESDRRCMIIENNQIVPTKDYFDELVPSIHSKGAMKMLYDELLEIDISKIDWINDRPRTSFMNDLRKVSMERELMFLYDQMYNCNDEDNMDMSLEDGQWISFKTVLKRFERFNKDSAYRTNIVKFGIKISKLNIPPTCMELRRKKDGKYMKLHHRKLREWFVENRYHEEEDSCTTPLVDNSNVMNPFEKYQVKI